MYSKPKKKHKKSKENNDKEPIFLEENNGTEVSTREFSNESFSNIQVQKKKSHKNHVEQPIFTEVPKVFEIPNEKIQPVDLFCNVKQVEITHKKSKKNKNKNFLDENDFEILYEDKNFGSSFSTVQKAGEKIKKIKNIMDEESVFSEKNSAVLIPNDKHQFTEESIFDVPQVKKKHKKSKNNNYMEHIFLEKNNSAEVLTREFSIESFSNSLKVKKKQKNHAEEPIFTEVQKVLEIPNEEIQSVDLLCNILEVKKKHKKSKKNKEFLYENDVEVLYEGNNFETFSIVHSAKEKIKKIKNIGDEESDFTDKNSVVLIPNNIQQVKKKHKKSKKNNDMEPIFLEENNGAEVSTREFSSETFSNTLKVKKKKKKSKKNYDEKPIFTEVQKVIEIPNEENQPVYLFSNIMQVKKKHKKSKKNKYKEFPDKNNVGALNEGNNFETSFSTVHKAKERIKKFKNIMDEESVIADENSAVVIPNDKHQFTDESVCDVQKIKKKHKKSKKNNVMESIFLEKSNGDKVSTIEFSKESISNSLKFKKSHKNYVKDSFFTEEQKANEIPNEEIQTVDLLCNILQVKNKHKKSEKNKHEGNNFRTPFSTVHKAKEKRKELKNIMDEESVFADKSSAVVMPSNEHQLIDKSVCNVHQIKEKHKKSIKDNAMEPTFLEEKNGAKVSTREFSSETFSNTLKAKKKNNAEEPIFTEVQKVIEIPNEEIQPVDLFSNIMQVEKKHKKFKKCNNKEFLVENDVEILYEGNNFGSSFSTTQKSKEKIKHFKNVIDKESVFSQKKSTVLIQNDKHQLIDESIFDVQVKKKHKKSKTNYDIEPIFLEENNGAKISIRKFFSESFSNILKVKKKLEKSQMNHVEDPIFTEKQKVTEISNEEIQPVDLFCNIYQVKKKHEKSIKNKDKVLNLMEERDIIEIPNEPNLCGDMFCDVQQAKEKYKQCKKNKNNEQNITEENNIVKIAIKQNQSVESSCGKQMKKKHKKSEVSMNKENLTENLFCDLKQLGIKHKKSDGHKDKESAFSAENFTVDSPNKECQFLDSFCNIQQSKEKHKKSENNTTEESTLTEKNNVFRIETPFDEDIILEKCILGTQRMKNTHKSGRSHLKTSTEHLTNSSMINHLPKISKMSGTDDLSIDDNQNSNNNKNVQLIDENLRQTDSFNLDFCGEPADFDIPPLHAYETLNSLTDKQRNELLSQGVTIKTGRFTPKEDKIIKKNFENFEKMYGKLNFFDIFGFGAIRNNPKNKQFFKETHFYARLGNGLKDRALSSIYKRARRILHPFKNKGKFSQAEIENIKHLRLILNKKWAFIAENLEHTPDKCYTTFKRHEKSISLGRWTAEEEKQLIAAMEKVIGNSDLSYNNVKKISWEKVASYVPSRTSYQCRHYWAYNLSGKSETERSIWNKSCNKKLLEILRKDWYTEVASKIDWSKVYESFKTVSPSPLHVQKRWIKLKTKISDFKNKDYKTILDELCNLHEVSLNETFNAPFSSSVLR